MLEIVQRRLIVPSSFSSSSLLQFGNTTLDLIGNIWRLSISLALILTEKHLYLALCSGWLRYYNPSPS
jgi:hypothetical protein